MSPPSSSSAAAQATQARSQSSLKQDLHIGVVASLHTLGLLDACCREDESVAGWQTITAAGYGGLVRHIRARSLDAAILPLEWFFAHFLAADELADWAVVQAWPQCALQFWMSRHLKKRLARLRRTGAGPDRAAEQELRVVIDAAGPALPNWVTQRLAQLNRGTPVQVKLQALPVSMMPAGLKAGLVDAMVAPAPWSQSEDLVAEGSVDRMPVPPAHDFGLVLVVRKDSNASGAAASRRLIQALSPAAATRLDPGRLSCSHHAAMQVHNFGSIAAQVASLAPPVPHNETARWLARRLETLREAEASFTLQSPAS